MSKKVVETTLQDRLNPVGVIWPPLVPLSSTVPDYNVRTENRYAFIKTLVIFYFDQCFVHPIFLSFGFLVFWSLYLRVFIQFFFRLAHLALQNASKEYVIFLYFPNFITKSDQKPKTKNGMNETYVNFFSYLHAPYVLLATISFAENPNGLTLTET